MLKYENISTETELQEFVESLNKISHHDQYLLFNHIFQVRIYEIRAKGLPKTPTTHYQTWFFPTGKYAVFTTVKINTENPIVNPDYKTGFYEKFHFHLQPDDTTGISQP